MNARQCSRSGNDGAGSDSAWPLERVLFALAGTVTLLSVALVALVSTWFLLLTAFVGVNQWLYVLFGACPASLILGRVFGLRSVNYAASQAAPGAGSRNLSEAVPHTREEGFGR